MNGLDWQITTFFNSYAQHSWMFDKAMNVLATYDLFKGGIIVPLLWWLWFRNDRLGHEKEYVLSTLMISFAAIAVARLLALTLPFRPRPLHNPAFSFTLPFGTRQSTMEGWSAFPSDHAVLFFALATGIFLLSRKAGICAYLHAILIISLPRVYLGLHHATDILGGAVIGIAMASLVRWGAVRQMMFMRMLEWERSWPGLFYATLLIFSYQLICMFEPIRSVGSETLGMARHLIGDATFVAGSK